MENEQNIKFRTVPRRHKGGASPHDRNHARFIYILCAILAGVLCSLLMRPVDVNVQVKTTPKTQSSTTLASYNSRMNSEINNHLQDIEVKRARLRMNREIENLQFHDAHLEPSDQNILTLPEYKMSEEVNDAGQKAARIYEDINGPQAGFSTNSPADKINARLADKKWYNEQDRAEKMAFLTNFIRSAKDQGYELEINQDLVVVGLKRVGQPKMNINQVLDTLAKRGF